MTLHAKPVAAAAAEQHARSVLLVEDEESIAEPFARALGRKGFQATVARTGAEAIALPAADVGRAQLRDQSCPAAIGAHPESRAERELRSHTTRGCDPGGGPSRIP